MVYRGMQGVENQMEKQMQVELETGAWGYINRKPANPKP